MSIFVNMFQQLGGACVVEGSGQRSEQISKSGLGVLGNDSLYFCEHVQAVWSPCVEGSGQV
jgi:hypothetical protein